MTARKELRAVKTLVTVTINDSFRIRPRTEVSSLLIVQPAGAKFSPVNPGWVHVQSTNRYFSTAVSRMYRYSTST